MKSSAKIDTAAVIVCAGKGERAALGFNKAFYPLGDKAVMERSVDAFRNEVDLIVVVAAADELERARALLPGIEVIAGGDTRTESVRHAIEYLDGRNVRIVLVHDGARPYVTPALIRRVIAETERLGSAIPVIPLSDSLCEVDGDVIGTMPKREIFRSVQTPQGFDYGRLLASYRRTERSYNDDGEVYMRGGNELYAVKGDAGNRKLTEPGDFPFAAASTIGNGFDVHPLVPGRPLILGGTPIPFEKGLDGHSDADVVTHAVMDAILSASALPDIGVQFPDTDDAYKGADSMRLLARVMELSREKGYRLLSVSAVVIAQAPKLARYLDAMAQNIADAVDLPATKVNLSATTTENLGVTADSKAIAAYATAITYKDDRP